MRYWVLSVGLLAVFAANVSYANDDKNPELDAQLKIRCSKLLASVELEMQKVGAKNIIVDNNALLRAQMWATAYTAMGCAQNDLAELIINRLPLVPEYDGLR